jgi:hypothetical protein
MSDVTKIALAIVTVALVATLVVNGPNTAKVVGATTSGFANSISAAQRG